MEWISVNDRLPENNTYCIIYGRFTKDSPKKINQALFSKRNNTFIQNCTRSKDVTHWMPLPDPPKDLP